MNITVLLGHGRMSGERGCAELLANEFDMKLLNNQPLHGEGDVIRSGDRFYPTGEITENNYTDALEALDTDIVFISTVGQFAQQLPQIVQKYPTILQLGQNLFEFAITPNARGAIPNLLQIIKNVDAIVAPSEYAESIMKTLGFRNTYHIPGPIDVDSWPETSGNSTDIVFLGRVEVIKNYLTPLLAMPRIMKEEINAGIAWMGSGNLLNFYQQMVNSLGLQDRVSFMGYAPAEKKKEVMSKARLFVQPSLSEMASRTLKEAMACGIPSVATDIGGHDFGESIIRVRHDSPKDFADAMIELLTDDKTWSEKHAKALEDVQKFDISKVKKDYKWLFDQMMKLDKFEER